MGPGGDAELLIAVPASVLNGGQDSGIFYYDAHVQPSLFIGFGLVAAKLHLPLDIHEFRLVHRDMADPLPRLEQEGVLLAVVTGQNGSGADDVPAAGLVEGMMSLRPSCTTMLPPGMRTRGVSRRLKEKGFSNRAV